ncbi:MAG: Gfo/Idh/MocA family oxidoreductase [Euryarchaeota archaeon]|nr:Gfo/Idh/MocA family oxidoreductase [Euryarchaeota archaeon]
MKIALIGTGYWGRNHAKVWKELKNEGKIDDVILCDISEDAVKPLAKDFGFEYSTDPRALMEREDIDAVDIASSTPSHYTLAKNAILHGKHVMVEKPMAERSEECKELIKIADVHKRVLMVGHIFRYHPALIALKKMIERGELGEIVSMQTRRLSLRYPRRDMGVLLALAIHDVDVYAYLLNENPDEILTVSSSNYVNGIEEDAHIFMNFSRALGHIHESWNYPLGKKIRELVVVGTESTARIDYLKPDEVIIYDAAILPNGSVKNEGEFIKRVPYIEPLKAELLDFVESIEKNKTPVANGNVGLNAVRMIEVAIQSAENSRPMRFRI